MTAAKILTDRADSYGRDAAVLRAEGDTVMAVAFAAIRDELRRCAAAVGDEPLDLLVDLVDALHDEFRCEIAQDAHVLQYVRRACQLTGGYQQDPWFGPDVPESERT